MHSVTDVHEPQRAARPAGSLLGGGRYRLLRRCGVTTGLEFWHAMDRALDREVALTIIDGGATQHGRSSGNEVFARTTALCQVHSPAVAHILDMVDGDSFSAVVAEWVPSVSLEEAASGSPSILGVARAVVELADAMQKVHESDAVLAIGDTPRVRVRVSLGGTAYVAFPGTPACSDHDGDLRGLRHAIRTLAPGVASPDLPLAGGTTAGAMATALRRIVDQPPPPEAPAPAPAPISEEQSAARWDPRQLGPIALTGIAALAVAMFGAIGWLIGTSLADPPVSEAVATSGEPAGDDVAPPPRPLVPVAPGGSAVYSPQQYPDNALASGLAIDGKLETAWSTDTYMQQFPQFKNGVGLTVALPPDTTLRGVWIASPSAGARIEIRTVPPVGGVLEETAVLGAATLQSGVTPIALADSAPHSGLTVWISAQAGSEGSYRTELSEIGFLN
ncbi:putative peptidoglycan lipid II flippase [Rhodococcus maanshanensis]|uniref:Putative peptidoglycan lipid II flippase n=2 Tax=Rhodococcus maanshanensis TaxID=183556 RepID=A0A1H7SJ81_9NOCA|nr:putative peptidoglycan lipid II flippase [Rhodococcus maanshanensis]